MGDLDGKRVLRIWNLETGESRDLDPGSGIFGLVFSPDNELLSARIDGIGRWILADGSFEIVGEFPEPIDFSAIGSLVVSPDGRLVVVGGREHGGEAVLFDLETGSSLLLDSHGPDRCGWLHPDGDFVATDPCEGPGQLKVGPAGAGPVHTLVGKEPVSILAVSPDGQWIATRAGDRRQTILLWPVPDLSQPPLETLPIDQLLAKLRALTNLRVVPDPESETGWDFNLDPFPGWEEVPTW
jgi:WD40 repeat protein